MSTTALKAYASANDGNITVHGRTYRVEDIRAGGDIGWGATLCSKRARYLALQSVPWRLPQDPSFERWFVLIGKRAHYFAVRADAVRDLR